MEGIYEGLQALQRKMDEFPPEAHWFCPKLSDEDYTNYADPDNDEEDASSATKIQRIEDGKKRLNTTYRFSISLGFSPEQAEEAGFGDSYERRVTEFLTTCDHCVRNYHTERKEFLRCMSEEFEDEVLEQLSEVIERFDHSRIDKGLNKAATLLNSLPAAQRTMRSLASDPIALTALYEALCCTSYHKSKENLSGLLGDVLRLVQTTKVLRIGGIVPATTRFLFDADEHRRQFASLGWRKVPQDLDRKTFEWAVQDALVEQIQFISVPGRSLPEIQRFWEGLVLIINKLDSDLITHSLRGLEVSPDVYHLALLHLSCDSEEILASIIHALIMLLEKSSKSFWSAYGAISPTAVAEQVFNSPAFERLLSGSHIDDQGHDKYAYGATSWITPFVESLPAAQQHDACRSMLVSLLGRYQRDSIPDSSKLVCCRAGLATMIMVLTTFTSREYTINTSTSFIMINNVLGLVDKFKDMIVNCATVAEGTEGHLELSGAGLQVIKLALLLDCKSLNAEFLALENGKPVDHGLNSHSESIWKSVLDSFRVNDMKMANSILQGITPLIGLEKFMLKGQPEDLHVSMERFNSAFGQLTEIVASVFERISDFNVENLRLLCGSIPTANPLFAGLTSAHAPTYDAAVALIKAVTDTDTRKEAISALLERFMDTPLMALACAARRINEFRTFAAVPKVLKTGRDVLDGLCNPQSGLLRSKASFTQKEQISLRTWWTEQWQAIGTSFQMVEQWSKYYDNDVLINFCRDAMEYAESLFEEYSIVANVLSNVTGDTIPASKEGMSLAAARKTVLRQPCDATTSLVKWLRLKDQYLVSTVVSLVSKILRRLGEFDLAVDDKSVEYIDKVTFDRIKTVLTSQQKAELRKAMEEHNGVKYIEQKPLVSKTQGKIDAWSKSANGVKYEPSSTSKTSKGQQGVIDVEQWKSKSTLPDNSITEDMRSISRTLDQSKGTLEQIRARQQAKQPPKPVTMRPSVAIRSNESIKQSRQREKDEKKQRDAAIIAKAKALRTPTVVGEGSGLKNLGIIGKDHAPEKGEMMVSSSEESEDEEEDGGRSLIKKTRETSKKSSEFEAERRRALMRTQQGPVKKTRIVRTAKDMRARLTPDMTLLHLDILKWDIFWDGDQPPGGTGCVGIANTYQAPDSYRNVFYPLLIAEAWRSLKTDRDETNSQPFDIAVVTRMSVDSFYEVSTTMTMADHRDAKIREGDIILLSKAKDPLKDKESAHCLARVYRTNRKKDVVEISYRLNGVAVNKPGGLSLAPNTKIRGVKISSITSTEREFAALKSMEYYDLCTEILQAEPSPLLNYSDNVLAPVERNYGVNKAQAKAIWSAKENDAFTLIQGPPGSGKTKTIVAMVGAILSPTFVVGSGVSIARPPGVPDPRKDTIAKKLLVCAPSNAAVDELVSRLKEGVVDLKGNRQKINVLRLGRSDAINSNVKDVTLDALTDARIEKDNSNGSAIVPERQRLHQEAGRIKEDLATLRPKLEEARTKGEKSLELRIQREIDGKKRDQARIGAKIDEDKDNGNTVARDNEINRRRIQQEIINGAHVLCSTLSGSGHDMFKNISVEFETVIIDEAAQSIELSALIPLKYNCTKCILVGDPKQLPPTVLSSIASSFGYDQSLFERMQKNHPDRIHLLDTQYRMHPEISAFPRTEFYDGELVDGTGLETLRQKPWHASALLGPYRFFDLKGTSSRAGGHSMVNYDEIKVALQLYKRLKTDYPSYDIKGKVGIITPYKGQLREIRFALQREYGDDILDDIDTNTTDAFQGREAEVIIFSCVRTMGGVGFLKDVRRMNVGLTRAKSSLWVIGDSSTLQRDRVWQNMIEDAKKRDRFTSGDVLSMLRKPLAKLPKSSKQMAIEDVQMEDVDSGKLLNGNTDSRQPSPPDVAMTDVPTIIEQRRVPIKAPKEVNSAMAIPGGPKLHKLGEPRNGIPTVRPTIKTDSKENSAIRAGQTPKRSREPSPTESPGPPKKMPTTSKGLARPGLTPLSNSGESKKDVLKTKIEPKSEGEPRAKASPAPQGERRSSSSSLGGESNGSSRPKPPSGLPPRPKIMKKRPPADPFLPAKPRSR
ncbi:hypothetical protein V495_05661 [Pseudogymnoascus sp. VKM F-4514 (FW-929)]|nr:hypothetical protein V495_05661 [Pseudogymnoascus sp. VKM F-4514 (FW-929)]KFY54457.1 hypothetical protein V497_07714 [Pseudogymnoascus sp. VKM F-4516 (FW-969)]